MIFDLERDKRVNFFATYSALKQVSLRPTSNIEISCTDDGEIHLFMPDGNIYTVYCVTLNDAISLFKEMDMALTYDKKTYPQAFI